MNILIVGCRRVGSHLVRALDLAGHDVSVLAESENELNHLDDFSDYTFNGTRFVGIPVDIDALRTAGIESVDAVACVTADDNTNLMAAQIATVMFHVPSVVCRVSDPSLKEVYSREFGLRVISPTNLTVETVLDALLENEEPATLCFGSSTIGFTYQDVAEGWIGKHPATVPPPEGRMLFGILTLQLEVQLASDPSILLQTGDKLIWAERID